MDESMVNDNDKVSKGKRVLGGLVATQPLILRSSALSPGPA